MSTMCKVVCSVFALFIVVNLALIITSIACSLALMNQLGDRFALGAKLFGDDAVYYHSVHMISDLVMNVIYVIAIILIPVFACCGCPHFAFGLVVVIAVSFPEQKLSCALAVRYTGFNDDVKMDLLANYSNNRDTALAWDKIQRKFGCCGANTIADWAANPILRQTFSVPDSCCVHEKKGCGKLALNYLYRAEEQVQKDDIALLNNTINPKHTTGCFDVNSTLLFSYVGVNIAIGVLSVVSACCLLVLLRATRS